MRSFCNNRECGCCNSFAYRRVKVCSTIHIMHRKFGCVFCYPSCIRAIRTAGINNLNSISNIDFFSILVVYKLKIFGRIHNPPAMVVFAFTVTTVSANIVVKFNQNTAGPCFCFSYYAQLVNNIYASNFIIFLNKTNSVANLEFRFAFSFIAFRNVIL